ncbi:hypothetical protein ABUS55_09320 [Citrobacter pasteurii]|uniref:hypothetical protein n=1 Tax=Citrobacter pasteurii TaxID=1563222 RepID=UPI00352C23BF
MMIRNTLHRAASPLALLTLLLPLSMVQQAWAAPCTVKTHSPDQTLNVSKTSLIGEDSTGSDRAPFTADNFYASGSYECPEAQNSYRTTMASTTARERTEEPGTYWLDDQNTFYIRVLWVLPNGERYPADKGDSDSGIKHFREYPAGSSAGPNLETQIYTAKPVVPGSTYSINKMIKVVYQIMDPQGDGKTWINMGYNTINIGEIKVQGWSCDPDLDQPTQDLGSAIIDFSMETMNQGGEEYYNYTDQSATSGNVGNLPLLLVGVKNCSFGSPDTSRGQSGQNYEPIAYWDIYADAAHVSPADPSLLLPNSNSTTKGLGFRFSKGGYSTMINLLQQEPTDRVSDYVLRFRGAQSGSGVYFGLQPYIAPLGNGETPQPGILNGTLFFKVVYY